MSNTRRPKMTRAALEDLAEVRARVQAIEQTAIANACMNAIEQVAEAEAANSGDGG